MSNYFMYYPATLLNAGGYDPQMRAVCEQYLANGIIPPACTTDSAVLLPPPMPAYYGWQNTVVPWYGSAPYWHGGYWHGNSGCHGGGCYGGRYGGGYYSGRHGGSGGYFGGRHGSGGSHYGGRHSGRK